ncbi:Hypothetical_protein [Hexamita inflata]|uniref:Hypothetical_protein n=1 Tax=Hexamita inflata TaxID=28002 RepID=A0ABP1HT75_9EUKA
MYRRVKLAQTGASQSRVHEFPQSRTRESPTSLFQRSGCVQKNEQQLMKQGARPRLSLPPRRAGLSNVCRRLRTTNKEYTNTIEAVLNALSHEIPSIEFVFAFRLVVDGTLRRQGLSQLVQHISRSLSVQPRRLCCKSTFVRVSSRIMLRVFSQKRRCLNGNIT